MNSSFLKLDLKDLSKGISVAVIVVVLGALKQGFTEYGFDFGAFDWVGILNVAMTAGGAYLTKNLLSTEDNKLLGKIG